MSFSRHASQRFPQRLMRYIAVFSGIGAGFSKLMQMPGEVYAYGHAGLGAEVLYLFGAVQMMAAFLMLFARTRRAGGVLLGAMFGVSAYLLIQDDAVAFGLTEAGLAAASFLAAFWQRGGRRGGGSYVQPGSEIWR